MRRRFFEVLCIALTLSAPLHAAEPTPAPVAASRPVQGTRALEVSAGDQWSRTDLPAELAPSVATVRVEKDGTVLVAAWWFIAGEHPDCKAHSSSRAEYAEGAVFRWTGAGFAHFSSLPTICNGWFDADWGVGDAGRTLRADGRVLRVEPGKAVEMPVPQGIRVLALGSRSGAVLLLGAQTTPTNPEGDDGEGPIDLVTLRRQGDAWTADARLRLPPVPGARNAKRSPRMELEEPRPYAVVDDVGAAFAAEEAIFWWTATRGVAHWGGDYSYSTNTVRFLGAVTQTGKRFGKVTLGQPFRERKKPRKPAHDDADGDDAAHEEPGELDVIGVTARGEEPWLLLGRHPKAMLTTLAPRGGAWVSAVPDLVLPNDDSGPRAAHVFHGRNTRLLVQGLEHLHVATLRPTGWRDLGLAVDSLERPATIRWPVSAAAGPDGDLWVATGLEFDRRFTKGQTLDPRVRLRHFEGMAWQSLGALVMPFPSEVTEALLKRAREEEEQRKADAAAWEAGRAKREEEEKARQAQYREQQAAEQKARAAFDASIDAGPLGGAADDGVLHDVNYKLRQRTGRLRQCFELARASKPAVSGKVSARFVLTTAGNLDEVTVTADDPTLATCIAASYRGIRGLPLVAAPITFTCAYEFKP